MLLLIELVLATTALTATITRSVPLRRRLPRLAAEGSGCTLCVAFWSSGAMALAAQISLLDWLAVWGGAALATTWLVRQMDRD